MASKKKRSSAIENENKKSSTEYYRLNTQAVDDLVNADDSNSPEVPQEELDKYRSRSKFQLPEWAKAVLIKIWFGGAVCFFILWGLGIYITDQLDMLFVLGVALGIVTDILVNNIFRFYEKTPGANDRWMMFPKKNLANFFLNILYCFVLMFCIYNLYNIINMAIIAITGAEDTIPLGVEPLFFGTFYMGFDMLFIGVKHTFAKIIEDAKKSVRK